MLQIVKFLNYINLFILMEDIELHDTENYSSKKDEEFSHQILIMNSMKRCIDTGSKEMRSGYVNQKIDVRGSVITQYIPDTRMEFVETVETCECMLVCDFDDEVKTAVEKLKKDLKEKYEKLCKEEKKAWEELPLKQKHQNIISGIVFMEGYLSRKLPYYQEYIGESVKTHRDILKEFVKLTKRLGFFEVMGLAA